MKYTALYRKYRPAQFKDVYGQDHIVSALVNQIRVDRIAHAYLFCGTRGTGKTTLAKIFASAVNCSEEGDRPCCSCSSCKAFMEGRSLNVIEMDAASNNGVDDVRNIVEEVAYPPVEGRYKVYIIDEVHMLSVNAFNALLKTLEEPPEYVIFILATTEPNKLPSTILSRCQKYEFRQISSETIHERLKEIAAAEDLAIEDPALEYIARAGEGSMRDALSVMDRCVAFGIGQTITLEMISSLLGTADYMIFGEMLKAIKEKKVIRLLELIKDFSIRGLDYYRLTADFLWYLRNVMVLKVDRSLSDILNLSQEATDSMKEAATGIEISDIIRYIEDLSSLYNRLKYSAVRRIDMEISLISMCRLHTAAKEEKWEERLAVSKVEQKPDPVPEVGASEKTQEEVGKHTREHTDADMYTQIRDHSDAGVSMDPCAESQRNLNSDMDTDRTETSRIDRKLHEKEETGAIPDMKKIFLEHTTGLMNSMLKNLEIQVKNREILLCAGSKLYENYFNDEAKKTELNQILEKSGHIGYNIKCICFKNPVKEEEKQDLEEKIRLSVKNIPIELEV